MNYKTLEEVIKENISLPTKANARGFYSVLCKVCNDHGKKGPRAGFTFQQDGIVGYHCFNCGLKAKFSPQEHSSFSKNMKEVLNSFNVSESEYKKVLLYYLKTPQLSSTVKKEEVNNLEPKTIYLPTHFYKLGSKKDDVWSIIASEYLKARQFDESSFQFYLSTDDTWVGRLIIPIYKNNNIIYYQGRKMDDIIPGPKYLSAPVSRECVFYNYKEIFTFSDVPLYIVEGFFDAFNINGVAIFGNDFTPQQIEILNKSKRKKVYIPDRLGNGHIGAKQAIENGWDLGFPEFGDCKDISEAIQKYGELYIIKSLQKNIYSGVAAEVRIKKYCHAEKKKSPRKN